MSNDLFKAVNHTAGQELRAVDLINSQKFLAAKLADQILDHLTPGLLVAAGDPDLRAGQGANADTKWCYALTASGGMPYASLVPGTATDKKFKLASGTLFQKIAAKTGDEAQLLAFTCDGTQEFTVDDGHATLPRVDLLQMKLEYETGDSQARVFANEAVYATLDFDPLCANLDTVVRPKAGKGLHGNNISVRTVSGGALGIVEAGNLITITFVTGVTTVTLLEAEIVANSNLLEVDTAGTGANILVSPGDVVGYTALSGGLDELLVSQNMDMQRRVLATFSIVTGTPAAAPCVIPAPTAGYVPVAAIIIPTLWIAGATGNLVYDDHTGVAEGGIIYATLVDLRMPLNVKRHTVLAKDFLYSANNWHLVPYRTHLEAQNPSSNGTGFQFDVITPMGMAPSASWATDAAGNFLASGTGSFEIQVQPRSGMRICDVTISVHGDAGGLSDITANLYTKNAAALTSILTISQVNVPNSWNTYSGNIATPASTDDQEAMFLQITGETGVYIDRITIFWIAAADPNPLTTDALVICPGVSGRLVGIAVTARDGGIVGTDPTNVTSYLATNDHVTLRNLVRVGGFTGDLFADAGTLETRHGGLDFIEDPDETSNVVAKGSATYGLPVWTNGYRAPFRANQEDGDGVITGSTRDLLLRISADYDAFEGARIYKVTFFIAEGI